MYYGDALEARWADTGAATVATYSWSVIDIAAAADHVANTEPSEEIHPILSFLRFVTRSDAQRSLIMGTWLKDTGIFSSPREWKQHRNFLRLVEAGDWSLKHIHSRMARGEVHLQWFSLLKQITGEDPVADQDRGFVKAMAAAWLQWLNERLGKAA